MNTKLVSGSVAAILMAAPLISPAQPKPSAKPTSPEAIDTRMEFIAEQRVETDLVEHQFPRHNPVKAPPPAPRPVINRPISPYAVRVPTPVYRPFVNAVAIVYPRVGGNHFYWGNCTWYVATRRYIPWFGDAGAWAWNAVAYGFRTGYRPAVGAIWQIGNHVAYVEAVYANGSFLISEMNWWGVSGGGFGRVDRRTIAAGSGGVFIY